jgi:hypothetical protein
LTQYPLYDSINYRGKKKPEINKDLAEQGKEENYEEICNLSSKRRESTGLRILPTFKHH